MRQRVMIAMALACNPKLLIADEPTTALDVTIQAQILNIIRDLQQEMGTAVIFITHDMGVVAEMADDVVVMWKGEKVEEAPVREIFAAPKHPYTRALLSAVPRLGSMNGQPLPKRTPVTVIEDGAPKEVGETHVQDTANYTKPILQVDRLTTRFDVGKTFFGRVTHRVHAVEEVSFDIYPGETLALVGESGSGKSTIGRTLQQLIEPTGGTVRFDGRDMGSMNRPTVGGSSRRSSISSRIRSRRSIRAIQLGSASPSRSSFTTCSRTARQSTAGFRSCSNRSGCFRSTRSGIRTSFRAASGSGSASRVRLQAIPS